jgi:hypothetical protein
MARQGPKWDCRPATSRDCTVESTTGAVAVGPDEGLFAGSFGEWDFSWDAAEEHGAARSQAGPQQRPARKGLPHFAPTHREGRCCNPGESLDPERKFPTRRARVCASLSFRIAKFSRLGPDCGLTPSLLMPSRCPSNKQRTGSEGSAPITQSGWLGENGAELGVCASLLSIRHGGCWFIPGYTLA